MCFRECHDYRGLPGGVYVPVFLEKCPKSPLFPKMFFDCSPKGNSKLLPRIHFVPKFPEKFAHAPMSLLTIRASSLVLHNPCGPMYQLWQWRNHRNVGVTLQRKVVVKRTGIHLRSNAVKCRSSIVECCREGVAKRSRFFTRLGTQHSTDVLFDE